MKKNKLELLDYTSDQFKDIDLSNVLLIGCQHLLGTTINLFDELFKKGLNPQNVFLIGKCYSTNNSVSNQLKDKQINISPYSKKYNSHQSYDRQFKILIKKFIDNIVNNIDIKTFQKIIVLDDGGELICQINDLLSPTNNIYGVEQTSSGFNKIRSRKLNFPVINVARSRAKLEYESPLIARLTAKKIKLYLDRLGRLKILIVGQGPIGKGLFKELEEDHAVTVYDKIGNNEHPNEDFKNRLDQFDVIIGATGDQILSSRDFKKMRNNVILISVSSSDREFASFDLRRHSRKNSNCHKDIRYKNIKLLNSGFPINFDGTIHSLAPKEIQLTRSLLLAAILQGYSDKYKKKIIDLDNGIQDKIIKRFKQIL